MRAFGQAVRLMLVTAQRRSEVGDMEWRELDQAKALWTLPRERVKSKRGHEVPLSALALSILAETPLGPHVFTTRAPRRPQEGQAKPSATAAISGWSKFKERLDGLALAELKRLAGDDAVLPEWHLHDLRRTASTRMGKLGVPRLHISKVLNHAETGVTGSITNSMNMRPRNARPLMHGRPASLRSLRAATRTMLCIWSRGR